jgi:hypothetical protein
MSGTGQVISCDCSVLPEAEQLPWQADALQDLALTRNRPCYDAMRCVDKKLGVIFDVDTSMVRAT